MNHLQSLVQDGLLSTSHVEHAAIIRRKDSSLRASSSGFILDAEELSFIIKLVREPTMLRSEGFHLTCTNQVCSFISFKIYPIHKLTFAVSIERANFTFL